MKTIVLYLLIWITGIVQCFGQTASKTRPVIDMHLNVYSAQSYWSGTDYVLKETTLPSPKNNIDHIKAVLEQIKKHDIFLTYAGGDFGSDEMTWPGTIGLCLRWSGSPAFLSRI